MIINENGHGNKPVQEEALVEVPAKKEKKDKKDAERK